MVRRETLKPLQIPLVNVLSKHRWNVNVETTVCFNQSPSPPLQSQGVDSKSAEPQRDGAGGGDRQVQRHEKRKDTHRERKMIFFLASKTKTKDFNLAARKRQPLLIESGIKIRFTCEE